MEPDPVDGAGGRCDRQFQRLALLGSDYQRQDDTTTGGGTGIRSRAAYVPDHDEAKSFAYTVFDLSGRVAERQPGHFMILDGDLYWPECRRWFAFRLVRTFNGNGLALTRPYAYGLTQSKRLPAPN